MKGLGAPEGRTDVLREPFSRLEGQVHAARLGMWVFLASEVLLFAGLFALYASYRAHYPNGFREAVHHNTKVLGSINTLVLLTSSACVAAAVHALREGRTSSSVRRIGATGALGIVFLAIKAVEYGYHFKEGIYPGGGGGSLIHAPRGVVEFWTLYFLTTGLHAVHVTVGLIVLATLGLGILRRRVARASSHYLELGAVYWHLVDVIWIFLWPLFYLA